MPNPKIEIIQAKSPKGNVYLIHKFEDKNPLPSFEIYKLVKSRKVAEEFGISKTEVGRASELNTREMCQKMIEKIKK